MKLFYALLLIAAAAVSPALAADGNSTSELIGFDKRRAVAAAPTPEQRQAHQELRSRVRSASVDFDPFLGSPKWVRSLEEDLTGPKGDGKAVSHQASLRYQGDEHQAVKAFLDDHRRLYGHGAEILAGAIKTRDHQDLRTGVRMTAWQQRVDEIPVYESIFIAQAGRGGQLLGVSSQFLPDPAAAANRGTPNRAAQLRKPAVTARQAIDIAVPVIGEKAAAVTLLNADPKQPGQPHSFHIQPLPGDATASLVWFPLDRNTLRLAWEVELNRRQFTERFRVLVDAQSGEVLLWRKLTVEFQPVTYRVFTNDSPTPMRPGWPSPNAAQPPLVSPALVSVAAVSSNASPLGWLNDGETILRGNNVDSALDRNGDDAPDLPRVSASIGTNGLRVFDFPLDATRPPSNYSAAASVQLFYWCNWMHDRLYDIGFVEPKGNFQKDNFGRGGVGNDWVVADAQDGSGFNNANFTPTRDGVPARIQMYVFTGPNPQHDGDLDAEVILHEYTHGMSDRRVGHGVGISQFQTYGMGEGWSDFFAEAMLTGFDHDPDANYPMGGYSSYLLSGLQESFYYGIRRYPYTTHTNISPLMFQDIDTNQASSYPGIPRSPVSGGPADEVHHQGEVWCLMLWEVRASLLRHMNITRTNYQVANDFIMRLVADGMDWTPPNPTFTQARDGILAADRAITGGTNASFIWAAFAKRGLGANAIAPDASSTAGVVPSWSTPSLPSLAVVPATIEFTANYGGVFLPESNTFSIVNQSIDSITWAIAGVPPWLVISPTNGVLASQAGTNITVWTNGFVSAPEGISNILLTCFSPGNTNTATAVIRLDVGPPVDSLAVSPTDVFQVVGDIGGPFGEPGSTNFPAARTYTLEASDFVAWYVTNVPPWLTLSRSNGALNFAETVAVTATVNTNANLLPGGLYAASFAFVNSGSRRQVPVPIILQVGRKDSLVEDFNTHPFDLQYSTLTLTPTGNGYSACTAPASVFPTDPAGTALPEGDDTYLPVNLTRPLPWPNSAIPATAFWIGANGNVAINPGFNTNAYYGSEYEFFAQSRIAPLFADLNPLAGGSVQWKEMSDRVVVSWIDVPQFGTVGSNSVQLEMFFDGQIRMTWLKIELPAPSPYPVAIVGLSAGLGVPPDFTQTDLSAEHDCAPSGRILAPAVVQEGATNVQGTIILSIPATNTLLATLSSDNGNAIVVPPFVVLTNGLSSFNFPITVIDDGVLDGTEFATITASFPDRPPATFTIAVNDSESTTLYVAVPGRASEGDGLLKDKGIIFLDFLGPPAGRDVTIALESSNPDRVSVPAAVIIPAGAHIASFDLTIHDDNLLNGLEDKVDIIASVPNWGIADAAISVGDNESYALSISAVPQVAEGGGSLFVAGTVTLSGIPIAPVTVNFVSANSNALYVPGPIVIPAGAISNTFGINVLNNKDLNTYDSVQITAFATNYLRTNFISASTMVAVIDDERPSAPTDPFPLDGSSSVTVTPGLTWLLNPAPSPPGSTIVDVYLDTNSPPRRLIGTTNSNTFAVRQPLLNNTTYYWQLIARHDAYSATSAVWSFTTAPFDHFSVEPLPSPQFVGAPFQATVTARDAYESVVLNYQGRARLTNAVPSRPTATVAITEVDTGDVDAIEIQNVSDRVINIAGWQVIAYDWTSWPNPKTTFTIPGPNICRPGEAFQVRSFLTRLSPGAYPTFIFATNTSWNYNPSNNPMAVMVRDTLGNIVDFVCAYDARPAEITVPAPVTSAQWRGGAIPVNLVPSRTYQRVGIADHDDASDWVSAPKSIGVSNPGLAVPFTNYFSAAMSAADVTSFNSGTGAVSVTLFDEARSLVLMALNDAGVAGAGARFDVLATNDLSVSIIAPDNATLNDPVQCRIIVTNSGAAAPGVLVTNLPPPSCPVLSATPSQGTCAIVDGRVICDLGTIASNSAVSVVVTAAALVPGSLTNRASIGRSGADSYSANNVASAVTLVSIPQLTILDATNSEPAGAAAVFHFPVRLSLPSAATTTVAFATSDGTANAGLDYIATNGVVVFPPGSMTQSVDVVVLPDTLSEADETFFVTLGAPVNAQLIRNAAMGTIFDDDGYPGVAVGDVSITEGSTTNYVAFSISLTVASGQAASIEYSTVDGTAIGGFDYIPVIGTAFFPPGITTQTVIVPILGDNIYEPTKTFALTLANPNRCVLSRFQGICTLFDDDTNELHHLAYESLPASGIVNLPMSARGSGRDSGDRLVPSFRGPVHFTANDSETSRTAGTGNIAWNFPFGAGFHDCRSEVIYFATELGDAGQITSMALDVVALPGQTLNNFTIRMKPYAPTQLPYHIWDSDGWVTNFQGTLTLLTTGWTAFVFRTPYYFDGVTNVLVDFSFNNSSYTKDGFCRATTSQLQRSLIAQSDSAFGDPLAWTNGTAGPVLSTNFPNARFTIGSRVTVTPDTTTTVTNGVWYATFQLGAGGTNITLRAVDDAGHFAAVTGLTTIEDSDGDGMPDWWEIAHGLNRFDPGDRNIDLDGDGLTNLQEYLAGTDPRDAGSNVRILSATRGAGNTAQITVNGVAGRRYVLEAAGSLPPTWATLGTGVTTPTNGPLTLLDFPNATNRFYRVRLQP